jgi:uncharacterized protein YndB with AHSA1/START domain
MPGESIEVSGVIPASPQAIYDAWLDPAGHAAMTGARATATGIGVGARFTAWDGYIRGRTLALVPGRRIVQSWRSTDFTEGSPDSRLEIDLERAARGTRVTIRHGAIPEGQGSSYRKGWKEHYLAPMQRHFSALRGEPASAPRDPPGAKPRRGGGGRARRR